MSTSDPASATNQLNDATSARRGHLDTEGARAIFSRRSATADASHLVPYLKPGLRVVDFGCGPGTLSLGLAAIVTPGEVLGIDISEASIAQAKAQSELLGVTNAEFRVSDILDVQLPEASFDVAHFSSVLAYQSDPLGALTVAYRALKPGGLISTREPQKEGDWFGGPHREACVLLNRLIIEDGFKSAGGDPCIGRRLGTLLHAAGFERLELTPALSPALSNVQAVAGFAQRRLNDPEFVARVVRRGWITAEQIAELARAILVWSESDESVVAVGECMAIGWKP
jgi:SAM-dependent methyltransferase